MDETGERLGIGLRLGGRIGFRPGNYGNLHVSNIVNPVHFGRVAFGRKIHGGRQQTDHDDCQQNQQPSLQGTFHTFEVTPDRPFLHKKFSFTPGAGWEN